MNDSVPSPCVSLCGLTSSGVCGGCFRTAEEITYWAMLSNDEKRAVVDACARRKSEAGDSIEPLSGRSVYSRD